MGADEVQTKGDPVRGRRYFWFNFIMIILLSLWVMLNSDAGQAYLNSKKADDTKASTDDSSADKTEDS